MAGAGAAAHDEPMGPHPIALALLLLLLWPSGAARARSAWPAAAGTLIHRQPFRAAPAVRATPFAQSAALEAMLSRGRAAANLVRGAARIMSSCSSEPARLRSRAIEGGDHITIAARSAEPTIAWIADRFDGRPAPSDCARL